ncbi:hypothetical protein SAMN02800687_0782 [Curtobacterium sp. UNCCL20]|uniref:hypothetical protein n=1 Tax=Curtobacterium sp. UNCCL20 TaxID=1502773 RepID=UPI00088F1013|nr:hypothetical protein [Curtobacterium sp. UNCCL20]SDQ19224.1 hypothetical protein SAMN02800687_0782 [Curtobacterium sp. UNCCL20]
MRLTAGAGLLASAFAPVVAVILIVRLGDFGWWGWGGIAACAGAVVALRMSFRSLAGISPREIRTKTVRSADDRVLAFTSSYVVPVAVSVLGNAAVPAFTGSIVLVAFVAVIYVRGGLYHLNPTLALAGFHLFEVTATNGVVTMLLTRADHLPQEGAVTCRYLSQGVAIQLKGDR